MSGRYRRRKALVAVLLFLAGTFSLRGWRVAMMIDTVSSNPGGRWWTPGLSAVAGEASRCEWKDHGPVLYGLSHPKAHVDGE